MIDFPKLPLLLFNTESRTKEIFRPLKDNRVTLYTCGPTVYHFAHIGNFRTYVFEDLLKRVLKFFGFQVMHVMNITDVDDKTIRGATAAKQSLEQYVQPYKNAFFVDIQTLGIERADSYPCATEYIPHMIDFIQKLIDKGIAYQSPGDKSVYFAIDKCPRYGRLSHLILSDLKVGAGDRNLHEDEYDKENVGDFVLWKAYAKERDGEIYWQSPFGPGRPGWHLECSTMAMHLLGDSIDLHCGAVDNIFPHHENEIAQSEMLSTKPFVRYWLHSEHLIVNGKKMSKSLGNFYTLRDLLEKGYPNAVIRYMLLHNHYRTQLNFTFEGIEAAGRSLQRLNDFARKMQKMAESSATPTQSIQSALKEKAKAFCEALADDLNISVALAAIFDLMHEVNVHIETKRFTAADAYSVLFFLKECNRVLGVLTFEPEESHPKYLLELVEKREQARAAKDWKLADQIRHEVEAAGYLIEDTPQGAELKKKPTP